MTSFNLGDISASLSTDVKGSGVSFLGQALKWENEEQGKSFVLYVKIYVILINSFCLQLNPSLKR